jgi:hypothetical protein
MIRLFLQHNLSRSKRHFQENKKARIIISILMMAVILGISVAVFYFAQYVFNLTQAGGDIFMSQVVPFYLYQIFLLITSFLIFTSTIIFSLLNFFKAGRDSWIMASPQHLAIFWLNTIKAILQSSWAIIIIILPLVVAMGVVFHFSLIYYLLALSTVLLFSVIASLAAILLIFILAIAIERVRAYKFKILASLAAIFTFSGAWLIWSKVVNMNLNATFQLEEVTNSELTFIRDHFASLPANLPANILFYLQEGSLNMALSKLFLLFLIFLLTFALLFLLRSKFLIIWQNFQESTFEASAKSDTKKRSFFVQNYPSSPEAVVYKKELLISVRSAKNLFWFIFLSLLLFAQIGVISLLGRYANIGEGFMLDELILAVQLGIVLFFVSAFILRFVFPSFSQEGSTSWIIGTAPLSMKKIFFSKYKFYLIVLSLIGLLSLSFYLIPLALNASWIILLIIFTLIGITTLTMLGLSMGVIFINFSSNDPNELSTSGPGIIFIISSLLYIFIMSYMLYLLTTQGSSYWLIPIVLVSLIIYTVFQRLALKSLRRIEFF